MDPTQDLSLCHSLMDMLQVPEEETLYERVAWLCRISVQDRLPTKPADDCFTLAKAWKTQVQHGAGCQCQPCVIAHKLGISLDG